MDVIEARYSLSPTQQGMLFHSMYEQQSGYYIEQVVAHLHEALRLPILRQSWQQVITRHPILRTSFHLDSENQLQQVVYRQVELPVTQYDWQDLSSVEQDEKLARYLQYDRQQSFDIAVAPLMRLAILQRSEVDYTLVWTFHHALLDGRSIAIVLQEVFALYDAYSLNQNCSLPERRPYQDYIEWLEQQSFASAEKFWREKLKGFTTPTQLPTLTHNLQEVSTDRSLVENNDLHQHQGLDNLGQIQTPVPRYDWQKIQLSPDLTTALQTLAQEQELTLNTLVHGAWALLLSRYSGENDVVFGATRACRHSSLATVKSMVGLLINTLPVRVKISDQQLLPWLKDLRGQWVALRDYEQTPLVKVQSWSDLNHRGQLFNSLFIFDYLEFDAAVKAEGTEWPDRKFDLIEQIHYPLVLKAAGGDRLTLSLHFDCTQFAEAMIGQMLNDLETLLYGFITYPEMRVVELPIYRPSCFVVGDGVMPLSCLEILLKKGWQVLGVYSTDSSLQAWAEEHEIPHTNVRSVFQEQLLNSNYDYLFSINNVRWIIPSEVLKRARKFTINYHDSPLPKYAGLYATSWAILNGESEHAVTWHEVTSEIDAGRIFKQEKVQILADDTVFALNARCFGAAVNSFEEMILELASNRVELSIQDLSQRNYFGLIDRPAASSLLAFDVSSQAVCNLVRALQFGPTRNQLGVPKLWLPGGVVVVESARAIAIARGLPGQVLSIDAEGLGVATLDGMVLLGEFSTLEGKSLSIERLAVDYGVQVGEVLPTIDRATRDAITERNAAICRHEEVWANRLIQLTAFNHPYLPIEISCPERDHSIHRYPICAVTPPIESKALLAIFAAYCARLTTESEFDLGLQTDAQRSIAPEIFAQRVPLRVQTQVGESFHLFKERLETSLNQIARLGSFRHSLLRRYPELRDYAQSTVLPVAIVLAPSPDQLDWRHLGATLAFVAYEDGSQPEVAHCGAINQDYSQAIVQQLETMIAACLADPDQPLDRLPLLSRGERQKILVEWNQTATSFPTDSCIHELFEQQVLRTPDAIALVFEERQLTYRQLNEQANQLAHYLQLQGVGPDVLVGIHMERSLEMMVGLLGIHKAGGAYLPLDPDFPPDRLAFMLQDSQAPVILTQQKLVPNLQVEQEVRLLPLDTLWEEIAQQPATHPNSGVKPENLSYVIYTSGSTGKPKGVMVEHRNVVNFFTGMDDVIEHDPPAVWLAVTSLSFDISVLELFWTLARGFRVVIYSAKEERAQLTAQPSLPQHLDKSIDFSLFYFSSHEKGDEAAAKYRLLLEGTKFADANGFKAVWTPERHFHAFGGLFPNPAVTSAAIAAVTEQIQIRAGSCVSPLHSSIRIAEDWAVVDNLSGGRVGISFAAGWQPNDFVLRPETFQNRKDIMFQQIEEVRALWRGEAVTYPNGKGDSVEVQTLPRPIQPELPVWVTAAGNPETFREAGAKGLNLLTHLLGQSLDELAAKIAIYRQAWTANGHSGQGTVTLMLHTFVGQREDTVKEIVRQPMRHYLASSLDLIKKAAWSFPTFKQKTTNDEGQFSVSHLSEQDMDEVLDFSFERYFETSGLFGTVETCLQMVDRIKGMDVDEIACLIDYGVETEAVLAQLPLLHRVRVQSNRQATEKPEAQDNSVAELIKRHQVTHLQCTPSMASMLLADPTTRRALGQIRTMMVGGEAFTEALAAQLQQTIPGQIHNMYGPTETTIWSATHTLAEVNGVVPIGRPIANTELYILDKNRQPVPVGVAGELLIGGQGVTRGYLNRPELTQERFVPHPFRTNSAERLYRTGDLVRYRVDGTLEFLGRIDFQVKVRGYRIELGEIETLLSRHEAVREVVVIVREDIPGDKRLVAYLLPQPGKRFSPGTLRDYLLNQLPEYMVPSHFVVLEAFPLTPNHKVDRKMLPAPAMVSQSDEIAQTTPQTPLEQTLFEVWQKVLQVSDFGTEDNFFELGGNSLIAMKLIGEIRSAFNVDLPLINLFQYPTVTGIAKKLSELVG
jgi:natural product biosynthesis luciferase-like monooxygenase protein